jgi:hypothetical protein
MPFNTQKQVEVSHLVCNELRQPLYGGTPETSVKRQRHGQSGCNRGWRTLAGIVASVGRVKNNVFAAQVMLCERP